jgi:hypothetical protein
MMHGSQFINTLSTFDLSTSNVRAMTIAGSCGNASNIYPDDNTVRVDSVKIQGLKNHIIECEDPKKYSGFAPFHYDLGDPDKVSETYDLVVEFMKD